MSDHDRNVIEAEESILALCLLTPSLAARAALSADEFRSPLCRALWNPLLTAAASGAPVDPLLLAEEAGVQFTDVSRLALRYPAESSLPNYCRIVSEDALRRKTMAALAEAIDSGRGGLSGTDLISMVQGSLAHLRGTRDGGTVPIKQVLKETATDLAARFDGDRKWGVTSGVEAFDQKIGGFPFGVISTIAARPGHGKSSFGLAVAEGVSAAGCGVHTFTPEDKRVVYGSRIVCREGVDSQHLRTGQMTREELSRADLAIRSRTDRRWLVDDRAGRTAIEIVGVVRQYAEENETKVVIVDYLTLVRAHRERATRREELTDSLEVFAEASSNDGMAYVVLSQLNRQCENRPSKRPQMSDLKECGAIEEFTKGPLVMMFRAHQYHQEDQDGLCMSDPACIQNETELIVCKNNNGVTGTVLARWDGPRMRLS